MIRKKWVPVFRKRSCPNKTCDHDAISSNRVMGWTDRLPTRLTGDFNGRGRPTHELPGQDGGLTMTAPRVLCIGMPVRDLASPRPPGLSPARGARRIRADRIRRDLLAATRSTAAIGIARLGGRALDLRGRWATAKPKPRAAYIFGPAGAGRASSTKHLVRVAGHRVTPDLRRDDRSDRRAHHRHLPRSEPLEGGLRRLRHELLADCAAVLAESRCAELLPPSSAPRRVRREAFGRDRRRRIAAMSLREGLSEPLATHIWSSPAEPLSGDRGCHRRRLEDALTAHRRSSPDGFLAVNPGRAGHDLARPEPGAPRTMPGDFPVHTVEPARRRRRLSTAPTCTGSHRGPKPESRQALRFASAAAALKCTRLRGRLRRSRNVLVEQRRGFAGPRVAERQASR